MVFFLWENYCSNQPGNQLVSLLAFSLTSSFSSHVHSSSRDKAGKNNAYFKMILTCENRSEGKIKNKSTTEERKEHLIEVISLLHNSH